ncbi:unnamed protein product [Closterium sp. Naga37s-1]|nr:unnamed protein product [Closterium sp. Naga37s-1]
MAAPGDQYDPNAGDGDPSSSNRPRTGLDFLRGPVTEAETSPLPEPSFDSEGWQYPVRKVPPQSPPRQQELGNEDAVWQAPKRVEADTIVRDHVETTEIVTEAPESSNSVALKRPRYTQTTIGFGTGTPLVKPPPPPPPSVTLAPSPLKLNAAERTTAKFLEAQRNYITKWLPQFDWLLLDKGEDGLPRLRCSVCSEHGPDNARYGRNGCGGRDLQPASMRAHQASTRHEDCIDRQKGLFDKLAAQKKIADYERADPEGARVIRLMRSIQFVCDEDAPISMFPRLVEFLAREGVSDIPQQGYGVYITEEVLAVKELALKYKDLDIVDAAIRGLGDIVTKSSVWHERFKELQQEFHQTNLEHQGLFDVRWLSRGDAVQRLCKVLGVAVVVFIEYGHKLAAMLQTLKFHFCVYFLADLLAEINALNKWFQRRKVDITLVHQEVDRTIACIRLRYVEYDNGFGGGVSKLLSPFIARMANGKRKIKVDGVDAEGEPTSHEIELSEEPIKGHKFGGTMADCIKLCKAFAVEVATNLHTRMHSLKEMEGSKLYKVETWPEATDKRERRVVQWLDGNARVFKNRLPGVLMFTWQSVPIHVQFARAKSVY